MPEQTPLTPSEEALFRQWINQNGITDVDTPDAHYDYRGFWQATHGAPHPPGSEQHFPDTFKTHGHPTFSIESQYSSGPSDGGMWAGDSYIPQPKLAPSHNTAMPIDVQPPNSSLLQLLMQKLMSTNSDMSNPNTKYDPVMDRYGKMVPGDIQLPKPKPSDALPPMQPMASHIQDPLMGAIPPPPQPSAPPPPAAVSSPPPPMSTPPPPPAMGAGPMDMPDPMAQTPPPGQTPNGQPTRPPLHPSKSTPGFPLMGAGMEGLQGGMVNNMEDAQKPLDTSGDDASYGSNMMAGLPPGQTPMGLKMAGPYQSEQPNDLVTLIKKLLHRG